MHLQCQWTGRVPDIFADVDADMYPVDEEDGSLAPSLKVAILIKNAIVGQVVLVVRADKPSCMDNGRRVINVAITVYEADHSSQPRQVAAECDEVLQLA